MTSPYSSLDGKVAIVTGSAKEKGIGAAIATALARHGAWVVLNHVSDSSAPLAAGVAETITKSGGKAAVVQADVSTPEGAKALVRGATEAFGVERVDILVNNAAAGGVGPILETTQSDIERIFRTNAFASIYTTQACVPLMPRGSRIINIGSVTSKLGFHLVPVYAAAKAAQDQLTFSAARELGGARGITVNTVAPGPVMTEGMISAGPFAKTLCDVLVPMTRAEERVGNAGDVADVVVFLASEKSRWVTGQFISVSGGITGG